MINGRGNLLDKHRNRAQSNFTDPESGIMKIAEGFQQCYNGQLVVDRDFQLIVENKLTANSSDNGELLHVLTGVENNLEKRPEAVLADAGYRDESRFKELARRHIDGYIALGRKDKDPDAIDVARYPGPPGAWLKNQPVPMARLVMPSASGFRRRSTVG